ncbi:MAG: energy-coupling factor transporter ATPase [Clostridia bacterium]|nr:energy-coupling factor transporter ATPase [Clostridia bacterium]
MECAISLKGVSYTYESEEEEGRLAVKDVSIDIQKGSFVAIVGHNGSGKSTLARMLNGLLIPTAGRVKVFGYDTCDEDSIYEVRRRVGMVFQNPDNQMVASVVEDDIAFGPENLGVEREEIIRRVDEALESVGMSEYRKSMPFRMSGGQKQRIAIAGALALCPEVLVLDESTAMLDPKGRKEVMGVIRRLNREKGMTVIHITHYMEETLDCDRVIVMNDGRVAIDGTPAEVFSRGEELKSYKIAPPYVTWLACALADAGLDIDRNIYEEKILEECLCRLLSKT